MPSQGSVESPHRPGYHTPSIGLKSHFLCARKRLVSTSVFDGSVLPATYLFIGSAPGFLWPHFHIQASYARQGVTSAQFCTYAELIVAKVFMFGNTSSGFPDSTTESFKTMQNVFIDWTQEAYTPRFHRHRS